MLDAAAIPFHTGGMKDDAREPRQAFGWALPASVALHLLVVGLLVFGLPVPLLQPEKEEAIAVTVVPPPEKPPEESKPKPIEKPKPEPIEKPKPVEKPKPKPEPAPPPEKAEPPKPDTAKAEPAPKEQGAALPLPTLRPVFQFGEKDAGPRVSTDGNGARDKPGEAKPPATSGSTGDQKSGAGQSADQPRNPSGKQLAAPKSPTEPDKQESAAQPAPTKVEALSHVPEAKPTGETQKPAPANNVADDPAGGGAPKLQEARTLFSSTASGGAEGMTAMGELPREVRGGQLCITELDQQLRNAWPPFFPDALPNYLLKRGTILEVIKTTFPADQRWYDLSFRCEVDQDVTRVVSFSMYVGPPLPRSEWERRMQSEQ